MGFHDSSQAEAPFTPLPPPASLRSKHRVLALSSLEADKNIRRRDSSEETNTEYRKDANHYFSEAGCRKP